MWKSTSASGAPDNSSLSHFSAMTRPSWLDRAARNRHRHAIEQASRRWREGRRDDSARTRRKILISTQVKRKTLLKESKVLLELFAKTHAAKYDTDIGVLELYQGGRRIDEATLICEVIEDLDATAPSISAAFVVKRRYGADVEDKVVSARSLLLQKRAPVIDDWSSQKDVLEANASKGPGQQQTSQEIRAYWDEQKQNGYKHWRTDAALRGFYTRTEDEAKVKAWDASLKPKRGFLEGAGVHSDEAIEERKRRDASLGSSEARLSSKRG